MKMKGLVMAGLGGICGLAGLAETTSIDAYQPTAQCFYVGELDDSPGIKFSEVKFFNGKESISGKEYLKLFSDVKFLYSDFPGELSFVGYIRCKDGQVYYLPNNFSQELLIFDFTLKEGDTVAVYSNPNGYSGNSVPDPITLKCLRRYSTESLAGPFEIMEMVPVDDVESRPNEWIVGLGTKVGLTTTFYRGVGGYGTFLDLVTVEGDTVYQSALPKALQ